MSSPRQEEILDRTLELVRESGLAGLTIRRIAQRVGFTEAAVYRHFPSKKALLAALVERLHGMLLDPIRALAADRSRPARERLADALAHHQRVILETDSLPILLLAEVVATRDEELVGAMRSLLKDYLGVLEGLAREAGGGRVEATGELPAEALVLLLLGLPAALAIRHRLFPGQDPPAPVLAALTRRAIAAAIGGEGKETRR